MALVFEAIELVTHSKMEIVCGEQILLRRGCKLLYTQQQYYCSL